MSSAFQISISPTCLLAVFAVNVPAFHSPDRTVIPPPINVSVFAKIADMFMGIIVKFSPVYMTNYLCCPVEFVQVNVARAVDVDIRAILRTGIGII